MNLHLFSLFFMALPFFYIEQFDTTSSLITLNEETSKHIVQVLRMQAGEQINLTDGKGNMLTAEITIAHKKSCVVSIKAANVKPQVLRKVSIAISLIKNNSRFEWFLEKATEIGVTEIVPLICERTERQHFRYDRMKGIIVSAMLQSQQTWLPVLQEPVKFENLKMMQVENALKLIAHCEETEKNAFSNFQINKFSNCIILIGPEGDFTEDEIQLALSHQFVAVTLGETRLRTETAGVVAAALLCIT